MVKTFLVGEQISEGKKLLDKLHKLKFPVVDAFWYQVSDSGDWNLIIASPKVREVGLIASLTEVLEILQKTHIGLSLSDIAMYSPKSPEYLRLRKEALLGEAPASGPVRDIAFSDAYRYALPGSSRAPTR